MDVVSLLTDAGCNLDIAERESLLTPLHTGLRMGVYVYNTRLTTELIVI